MKVTLLLVEKTQDGYIAEGMGVYEKRLKNYARFSVEVVQVSKSIRQRSAPEQKAEEARLILQSLAGDDHLVLLDEKGTELTSRGFAGFLQKKQNASVRRLVFVVGGPFGFDDAVKARANETLSLSKMTFSHQMVRLFFLEQLYRGYTILNNEKYHHD